MKRTIRNISFSLCSAALLIFALAAHAQNKEPTNPPPSTTSGTSGTNSPSQGTSGVSVAPNASWSNAPRKYIVQRGDTLWDISRRFLGSPWYWPKLWTKNPHIYNPHWIFPGNIINFHQGQISAPARRKKGLPDISTASGRFSMTDITVSGKIGLAGLGGDGTLLERRESFLDRKSVKSSGRIVRSIDRRTLLSKGDRVYVKFKDRNNVRAGEQYTVYRKIKKIVDPVSKRNVGWLVRLYGTVQIKQIRKRIVVARITDAFSEIQAGYFVGPYIHHKVKVKVRRNETLVKGHILRATTDVSLVGQFFQIFINKGSRHGVRVGNTFVIYRRGGIFRDQKSVRRRKSYRERIGAAVVIDVRRGSSVAVVISSTLEIQSGDEVETSLVY